MEKEYEVNEGELTQEATPVEPKPEEVQAEVTAEAVPEVVEEAAPEVVEEAAPEAEEEAAPVAAAKKESPFADSPYEMNCQSQSVDAETLQPVEKPKKKAAKKSGNGVRVVAALLAFAVVAASCGITAFLVSAGWKSRTDRLEEAMDVLQDKMKDLQQEVRDNSFTGNGNSVSGTPNVSNDGLTPGQVYAKVYKSVVYVLSYYEEEGSHGQTSQYYHSGSGFIISEDGFLLTNSHVVADASKIVVTLFDGEEYPAVLVGHDASNDFAVLKIEATDLVKAELGSSDDLIVGDQVVAVGHPMGSEISTLTVGYISAKNQSSNVEGTVMTNLLQTDAATNSGSSGGALFNMKGEVVGITTAKLIGSSNSSSIVEGSSLAVPLDDIIERVQQLMEKGYISSAYLGVYVQDVDPSVLDAFGFPRGVYVQEAVEGFCAAAAGVQAKDMIIAVGDYKVDSVSSLTTVLQNFKGGDKTTITVWRAGAELVLDITLDQKPVS